jgi:predicted GNAT family acetyltransferase
MATLAELLRQSADKLINLPSEAQRFITNPQAFTQLLTGKNPLPRETGFAAGATGLPATEMSVLDPNQANYAQGYESGVPVGLLASIAPFTKGMPVGASIKDVSGMYKFKDIVDNLNNKGLIVDAYESAKRPVITLSRIEVPKEIRGKGIGTDAMQNLISYADDSGKAIALSPSKDFGASSVNRLKDFYKRFGFVENKGKNKDFSISESMYRPIKELSRKEMLEQELKKVVE